MTLREMRQLLREHDLRLTKSLGQNFLHDGNQLRRMVALAEVGAEDRVLEIGPGLGPLTELLLERAGGVLAIEKDARLAALLRERLGRRPGLDLRLDDALEFLRREPVDWRDWKVVSNLPYSVGSPILVELAECPLGPARMVVTLQSEVVQRLRAVEGSGEYGLLTLLVGLHYVVGGCFPIAATCFFPEPAVDSACVELRRRPEPLLSGPQAAVFRRVVKRAFSQRRKQMRKLLRVDWPEEVLLASWIDLGLSPAERAERVSLEQFARLARRLAGEGQTTV